MNSTNQRDALSPGFSVETSLIVFTRDGRAQFGWRDVNTGLYHGEVDGMCIADAVGAVPFASNLIH